MQKTLRLVTLLAWGLWIPAYAQAPTFSLPPIPGSGSASAVPAPPSAPKNPSSSVSPIPVLPGLEKITNADANKKEPEKTEEAKQDIPKPKDLVTATGSTNDPTNPQGTTGPIPYNVAPPPLTLDNPAPESAGVTAPPPVLPALALPAPPQALGLAATAIPETKAEPAKKAIPTWKEPLKPSYKPIETSFNFRRQVLPPAIYRPQYSAANRHLPTARTMQTYDHAFLLAVARNDVNAVRAMLANGRRNVNLMNAEGDSVLVVAVRHGAFATARLLIARGADPTMPGANGWSAYDYAQYWGNAELLNAMQGRLG